MAAETQLISSWHSTFEGMKQSSQDFYRQVETAVTKKEVPGVKFERVDFKEGGLFSSKREYLKIARGDLTMFVCGAPFGNGFFVSSRLFAEGSLLDGMLGQGLMKSLVKPDTFFKMDSTSMYLTLVHNALMEVVDDISKAQTLQPLPAAERKPVMTQFYQH